MKRIAIVFFLMAMCHLYISAQHYKEVVTFNAREARQAVAVDNNHFFAINNTRIVKYTLEGDSLLTSDDKTGKKLIHMNSGVVVGDKLCCAHSNYPSLPMVSSIEIFSSNNLEHIESISLGIAYGSCTWVLPHPSTGGWFVFFAHYENAAQESGKDVSWSQLVEFDKAWVKRRAWVLPATLLQEIRPYSLSGAVLIDNNFYCTGHDARKCYILRLPEIGSILEWIDTVEIPFEGQGIAVDLERNIWGIHRKQRTIGKACVSH